MDEEENLFPDDIDDLLDDELEEDEEEIIGYKIAPYFDSKSGDFIINGSGQIVDADEINAYIQWCENVIATQRYVCDGYSDDIGIDYVSIFASNDKDEIEVMLESEISEALAVDPYGRTQYVQNVEFEWVGADELNILVEVIAFDNELITIETTITY